MKKIRIIPAVILLAAISFVGYEALTGYAAEPLFENPGTHTAEVTGWIGNPMSITVTVDTNRIVYIETEHGETIGFGDRAIDTMTYRVLTHQTLGVDVVTGATLTSIAFLMGMHEALLGQAGGDPARLMTRVPAPVFEDTTADVVVVGSGVAGFTTAIRVASERPEWTVILLEKDGILGGTSLRASPGASSAAAQIQIEHGFMGNDPWGNPIITPEDDVRAMGGNAAMNPSEFRDFFRVQAANSKYLVNFTNEVIPTNTHFRVGVHGVVETHRMATPEDLGGFAGAFAGLEATALSHGVDIRLNNRGTYLLNTAGELAGLTCDIGGIRVQTPGGSYDIMLNADNPRAAVVLATGGIAGSTELKAEFYVNAVQNENTNTANTMYYVSSPATARHLAGDGHVMARRAGAALDMMHALTARPMGIPGQDISNIANADLPHQDNFLSGAVPRMYGMLYISRETGRRFSNEPNEPTLDFFDEDGVPVYYYGIMSHTGINQFNTMRNWYAAGIFTSFATVEELADYFDFDDAARAAFIDEMRQVRHVASHRTLESGLSQAEAVEAAINCTDPDCPFNDVVVREDFQVNSAGAMTYFLWGGEGPFYVTRIVPALHGTYGGIRTNINAQAVRGTDRHFVPETMEEAALDDIIPGLYAVGTVARPPRGSNPNLASAGSWGIAAANHILELPPFDGSYWED